MPKINRMTRFVRATALFVSLLFIAQGCVDNSGTSAPSQIAKRPIGVPIVRVRVMEGQDHVVVRANVPPIVSSQTLPAPRRIAMPNGADLRYTSAGWNLGGISLGAGQLTLRPERDGTVSINNNTYRGAYRFVPTGAGLFDVVNDVEVDSYVKGVVAQELYPKWHPEAYKAQAIVARTYAIYEAQTSPPGRHYDLNDDTRSQVYGGIAGETLKSQQAVEATKGIVVASGPAGHERIFKAYFSSCCGGLGQSAYDAFGDPPSTSLGETKNGATCAISTKFNWGPVAVSKAEVTRRIRMWGATKGWPEQNILPVARIDIMTVNAIGRPIRFVITDIRGTRYAVTGEDLRHAMNIAGDEVTLYSSYVTPIAQGNSILFTNGHGYGHGVGLCQWCAEARAMRGMRHEDIVLMSYPGAVLVRAY
jgi:stage II sporulation protein D